MPIAALPRPVRPLRRWTRRALIALGLLMVLFLAAWLALLRWLQGSGAALVSQVLRRELSVAEVSFQPWRLALQLQGIRVAAAAGQDPSKALLTLERVEAVFSWRSVWHWAPVLQSLRLVKPVLNLSRVSAGHYDIDDLLARWAKPSPAAADLPRSPMALALYNIELIDGEVLLDDRPLGKLHQLTALRLDLPFISTLNADVAVHVEPKLAGALNGVDFDSHAQWLPFAEQGEASLMLQWTGLDLLPYRAYFPDALPLRVQRGVVDADLALTFSQAKGKGKEPQLSLRGQVHLRDFALQTPAGAPWLAWRDLQVPINKAQPLLRTIELGSVTWWAPELALSRDADGQLWLPTAAAEAPPEVPESPKPPKPPELSKTPKTPKTPAWRFSWDRFELKEASVDWRDAAVGRPSALRLEGITAQVGAVTWPLSPLPTPQKAADFSFGMRLQPAAARGKAEASRIEGAGSLAAEQLALKWRWQGLALEWLAPYLQAQLPLQVRGQLSGRGELALATPLAADAAARVKLDLRELALQDLRVSALNVAAPAILRVGTLSLDRLKLDLAAQQLVAGELVLNQAVAELAREAKGAKNFQSLLPVTAAPAAAQTPADIKAKPWALQLAGLLIDSSSVQWRDANAGLALSAEQIRLRVQDLAWPAGAKALPIQLGMKLAVLPDQPSSGANRSVPAQQGEVQWQGQMSLAPLSASGSLKIDRLPLQWLDALLDPTWGIHLQQAELGLRSEFSATQQAEGWRTQLSGELVLADLQLRQARQIDARRVIGEDLLSWQALKLDGLKWAMNPGAVPQLTVAVARLDDFYARLIVNEGGRLNLRELGPGEPPARAAGAAAAAAAAAAVASVAVPALKVTIQQTQLSQGRVDFSDRFIRPKYSAQLTDLTGSLGAFSSGSSDMAALKLRGRVAGTGQLEIEGQVNPSAAPLTLDITAAASDIELAPLSPYAAKYAGYAIEQGKFSSKVHYKIASTGNLEASNQITLNQLTFGERVESPQATQLPVLLAVALLKDRNGVIDLNLPISGSINDPEFSVGGLLVRVVVNLLGRALTAPFSLFSSVGSASGSSSNDLSQAQFAPGSATPSEPAQLNQVARLLQERPGLNLTLTGWADASTESLALQQLALDAELRALRQRELLKRPGSSVVAAQSPSDGPSPFTEAERERLLKALYQASALPDKPRHALGVPKDMSPTEMQALLLASFPVTDERLRQLALERAVVVRDGLIAQGVPSSRIILATPNLATDANGPAGSPAGKWVPHVALQLGAE